MKRFFFLLLFVVNLQVVIQNNDFSICLLTEAYAQHMTQEAGDNCYDSEIGWYMSPWSDCRGLEVITYKCIYCGTAFKTDSERNQHEETCPQRPGADEKDHSSDPGNSGGTSNSGGGTSSGSGTSGGGWTTGGGGTWGGGSNNCLPKPRNSISSKKFYDDLASLLGKKIPITQGNKSGTCGPAVLEKFLLDCYPEKFKEAATSLFQTGQYKTWNLKLNAFDLNDADCKTLGFNTVDAIFQTVILQTNNILWKEASLKGNDMQKESTNFWVIKSFIQDHIGNDVSTSIDPDFKDIQNAINDKNSIFVIGFVEGPENNDPGFSSAIGSDHYVQIIKAQNQTVTYWSWGNERTVANPTIGMLYTVYKKK